jgi:hypothetical protein
VGTFANSLSAAETAWRELLILKPEPSMVNAHTTPANPQVDKCKRRIKLLLLPTYQ